MPEWVNNVSHTTKVKEVLLRLLKCSMTKKLFEVNILMDRWRRGDISIFDTKLVQSFLAGFKNSWNLGRSFSSWIPHYVVIL